MPLASTGSDLVTAVCMTIVIAMAVMLFYRTTRGREQDRDDDEPGALR